MKVLDSDVAMAHIDARSFNGSCTPPCDHDQTLEARFDSAPLAHIADLLEQTDDGLSLRLGQRLFRLPTR